MQSMRPMLLLLLLLEYLGWATCRSAPHHCHFLTVCALGRAVKCSGLPLANRQLPAHHDGHGWWHSACFCRMVLQAGQHNTRLIQHG